MLYINHNVGTIMNVLNRLVDLLSVCDTCSNQYIALLARSAGDMLYSLHAWF